MLNQLVELKKKLVQSKVQSGERCTYKLKHVLHYLLIYINVAAHLSSEHCPGFQTATLYKI